MIDRNQYDEIIVRYLGNELNAEEEKNIVEWIEADEGNKQYFEQLSRAWRLAAVKQTIESTDVNKEWHVFKQAVDKDKRELQTVDEYDAEIAAGREKGKTPVYRIIKWAAVAASIVLVITFGWNRLFDKKKGTSPVADTYKNSENIPAGNIRHEANASGNAKKLRLQDGSEIVLWAKSEVSFPEPFTGNKRDIILKGKADFKVAKDSTKPFTVISGDISTTALGTMFNVDAFEGSPQITVRLYEGKVVVKPVKQLDSEFSKGMYLLPGQELIYDNRTFAVSVRQFEGNNIYGKSNMKDGNAMKAEKDDPTVPKNEKGPWFMFNNQSLDHVFKQLEEMYKVEIDYSKKDVSKMYFIGKFDKTDSIDYILRQIGRLNNLNIKKEKNKYIIY